MISDDRGDDREKHSRFHCRIGIWKFGNSAAPHLVVTSRPFDYPAHAHCAVLFCKSRFEDKFVTAKLFGIVTALSIHSDACSACSRFLYAGVGPEAPCETGRRLVREIAGPTVEPSKKPVTQRSGRGPIRSLGSPRSRLQLGVSHALANQMCYRWRQRTTAVSIAVETA